MLKITFEIGKESEPFVEEFLAEARHSGVIAAWSGEDALSLNIVTTNIEIDEDGEER